MLCYQAFRNAVLKTLYVQIARLIVAGFRLCLQLRYQSQCCNPCRYQQRRCPVSQQCRKQRLFPCLYRQLSRQCRLLLLLLLL